MHINKSKQNERVMPRDANEIYRQILQGKLDAAVTNAMPLTLAGDFEGAEQMIRTVEGVVDGWLAIDRMYIAAISSLGGIDAAAVDRESMSMCVTK